MSENNNKQNNDNLSAGNINNADAELEDLISSVMAIKKSRQASIAASVEAVNPSPPDSDAPDITFAKNNDSNKPIQKTDKQSDSKAEKKSADSSEENVSDSEKNSKADSKHNEKASDEISENKAESSDNNSDASSQKNSKPKKGFRSLPKKNRAIIIICIIVLVFMLLIGGVVALFFHYTGLLNRNGDNSKNYSEMPIADSDITSGPDTFDEKEREEELKKKLAQSATPLTDQDVYNVLLIGEDVRDPSLQDRGNTDVMMIISINKKNETITMTSLMRDMWVYLSEFNVNNKLNAAYWHGGSEYLMEVVEQYFGIGIDRYVNVNFESFIQIVEAVGGLDFDVQENEAEAMKDPLDEVNDILKRKRGTGYVKAGKQHLDGYQSLAYARIRYNCGDDYGRTQRQRAVISQIIKKSKNLSFLELNDLLNKVLKQVTTDIPDGEIASMLLNAFDYMNYSIQEIRIPVDGYFTADTINSLDVLSPNFEANAAILQNLIYGSAKTSEEAVKQYEEESSSLAVDANGYDQNGNYVGFDTDYNANGYYDENGNYINY